LPWNETPTSLQTAQSVIIDKQDALQISAFQPFLTFKDTNDGDAQTRIASADGKLVFYTQSALNAGDPAVVFNSLVAAAGQPLPSAVEVHAQDGMNTVGFQPFLTLTDAHAGFAKARIQNANGDMVLYSQGGIDRAVPEMIVESASGQVHVTGTMKVDKTITCFDVQLAGADCAEEFEVAELEEAQPGFVMSLDEHGRLHPSRCAYDRRAAGVLSGAGEYKPGVVLDRRPGEPNRAPLALMGKVYCWVDAVFGAIQVGDLLTTSPTPGHAMKAIDHERAFGAVIGKALRPWGEGRGLIPILIALQ
jgi:hypothetical protein